MHIIDPCCKCLNPGCPPVNPPPDCLDCFYISDPFILYEDSIGPCNEPFSVTFNMTPGCTAATYSVVLADPAFQNLSFAGNVLSGTTNPLYAIPDLLKQYSIIVRAVCTAGASAGFSTQGIAKIPIIDRCYNNACNDGFCDPCTGLCGPMPIPDPEVSINSNHEIGIS